MAQNYFGHVTTAKRADTVSEHLTNNNFTGPSRFQGFRDAHKMNDAGTPIWRGFLNSLGAYGFILRTKLIKRMK